MLDSAPAFDGYGDAGGGVKSRCLTERERDRIRWYKQNSDLTYKQIGAKFSVSPQTVALVLAGKYDDAEMAEGERCRNTTR